MNRKIPCSAINVKCPAMPAPDSCVGRSPPGNADVPVGPFDSAALATDIPACENLKRKMAIVRLDWGGQMPESVADPFPLLTLFRCVAFIGGVRSPSQLR